MKAIEVKAPAMARLSIFCLPEELDLWLAELGERYDLAALVFDKHGQDGVVRPVGAKDLASAARRTFMMPSGRRPKRGMPMNDARARSLGWLDVEPGERADADREQFLLYSVIVGEDFENATVHPARFVRALKRRINKDAIAGAIGWNPVSMDPEEGVLYRDLWHTEAARRLYADGVVWKQSLQNRARFRPKG